MVTTPHSSPCVAKEKSWHRSGLAHITTDSVALVRLKLDTGGKRHYGCMIQWNPNFLSPRHSSECLLRLWGKSNTRNCDDKRVVGHSLGPPPSHIDTLWWRWQWQRGNKRRNLAIYLVGDVLRLGHDIVLVQIHRHHLWSVRAGGQESRCWTKNRKEILNSNCGHKTEVLL